MKSIIKLLSSCFYTGYVPRGSGTVASIVSCVVWVFLSGRVLYPILTLLIVVIGFAICGFAEKVVFREPDSPKIVIDEVAGMLLTYMSFSFSWRLEGMLYLLSGFLFFRLLDIFKPMPVSLMQRVKGGAGVMLDDVTSAVIANGLLQVLRIIFFR